MQKQEVSDTPGTEEPRGPVWTPPPPPAPGGREWFIMLFERFGFLIACVGTLLIAAVLFVNYDILLREPSTASNQATVEAPPEVAPEPSPAVATLPAAPEEAAPADGETGIFSIATDPASAAVFIDGSFIGISPLRDYPLVQGIHRISVQKQDFVPLDTVITLDVTAMSLVLNLRTGDLSTLASEPARTPATERLASNDNNPEDVPSSQPAGRTATVDAPVEENADVPSSTDALTAQTQDEPEEEAVPPPRRTERTTETTEDRANAAPARSPQPVAASSEPEEEAPEEAPLYGAIQVLSQPSGAVVYLEGQEVGVTPTLLTDVLVGRRHLALRLEGHDLYTTIVDVEAGQRMEVRGQLEPGLGTLKILAKPWGDIYIDGKLHKQETNFWYTTRLPPGTYRVRVEHPSLGKWEQVVMVSLEEERAVTVDFNQGNSN